MQAIAAYCYLVMIKPMCKMYFDLVGEGLTLKEKMSRRMAASSYRIQNWDTSATLTKQARCKNIMKILI